MAEAALEVSIPVGYVEYPHQSALHDGMDSARNSVILAHRRAGKTVSCVAQVIRDLYRCPLREPVGAYIAPTSILARRVALPYFEGMLRDVPGVRLRRHELTIEIDMGQRGVARLYLVGGENPDRLRGLYLDVAVVDEMADCPPHLITTVLRPALADRKGKLICIGTVKGRNEFWRLYERARASDDWFHANLTPDQTGMIDPDELAMMRREMSEDEFRQELLNDPDAAVRGAYYGKEMQAAAAEGRIREVKRDEQLPVIAALDLGWNDSTAVWFAQLVRAGELRLIDYVEFQSTSFVDVLKACRERHQVQRWIGPHDLNVHEYSIGQKRIDFARAHGAKFEVAPNLPLMDGIEAVWTTLPRCWFDEKACRHGIDALKLYRAEYEAKRGVLRMAPVHDWSSHGADAFRYLVLATNGGKRQGTLTLGVDYSAVDGKL